MIKQEINAFSYLLPAEGNFHESKNKKISPLYLTFLIVLPAKYQISNQPVSVFVHFMTELGKYFKSF